MTKTILLATRNQGKIREIKNILKDIPYDIKTLDDVGFKGDIPESGKSFEENAILKAQLVGDKTGLLTIAEDSGLEIDAHDGWPGIHSARHTKGTDWDKLQKVLEKMKGIPKDKRSAKYIAVVALYNPNTKSIQTYEGVTKGYITDNPEGSNGFGYDPIFWSTDLKKTFGNASDEEKNLVSHRARALNKLKIFLNTKVSS